MKVSVIIAAAGLSKRMGQNKQFLEIGGIPVLVRTLKKFCSRTDVEKIIVTMHPSEINRCQVEIIDKYNISAQLVHGGKERQDSIYNASLYIPETSDIILVHDGARCFIMPEIIDSIIENTALHTAAIPVVACKDTIKTISNNRVTHTPDRSSLCAVQTPQGFTREIFMKMYKNAFETGYYGTDDASLAEKIGVFPFTVPGDFRNIKITTPEDIALGELFAKENT